MVSSYKKTAVIKKKTGYKRLSAEPSLTCCPHSFGDSYLAVIENFLWKCLSWRQAEECSLALIRKLWKQGYKQDQVNYTLLSQFHCKTLFWTLPQPPLSADKNINRYKVCGILQDLSFLLLWWKNFQKKKRGGGRGERNKKHDRSRVVLFLYNGSQSEIQVYVTVLQYWQLHFPLPSSDAAFHSRKDFSIIYPNPWGSSSIKWRDT